LNSFSIFDLDFGRGAIETCFVQKTGCGLKSAGPGACRSNFCKFEAVSLLGATSFVSFLTFLGYRGLVTG
jgi:hypothetical protein